VEPKVVPLVQFVVLGWWGEANGPPLPAVLATHGFLIVLAVKLHVVTVMRACVMIV